jgi:hypothetical protein
VQRNAEASITSVILTGANSLLRTSQYTALIRTAQADAALVSPQEPYWAKVSIDTFASARQGKARKEVGIGEGIESLFVEREVRRIRPWKANSRCEINQLSERIGLHLSHHAAAMRFYRNLTYAQLTGDLLVWKPRHHQSHYLTLAGCQASISGLQHSQFFIAAEQSLASLK